MEILTKFKPVGNNVLIEHKFKVSNLAIHNLKDVKVSDQKDTEIKIVAQGDEVKGDYIGKTPMFTNRLTSMIQQGAAQPVVDFDNVKSIAYKEKSQKGNRLVLDNKEVDASGFTEFIEYAVVNVNYLVAIK